MRNVYYPQSKADYVAAEDLKRLKRDGVAIERDFAFGRSMQPGETSGATDETATPRVDLKMLSVSFSLFNQVGVHMLTPSQPRDAFRLLDEVVPPTLDFYRTPIAAVETRREPEAKRTSQEEALQAAPPPKMTPRQSPDNIYGSVSADDVDLAIKALLQNQGMGGLVTLPEEDIRFVHIAGTETEAPRIKKLGEYEYEIRIRGHEDVIRRAVRVLPDDIEEANREIPEHGPSVAIGGPDDVERVQQPA